MRAQRTPGDAASAVQAAPDGATAANGPVGPAEGADKSAVPPPPLLVAPWHVRHSRWLLLAALVVVAGALASVAHYLWNMRSGPLDLPIYTIEKGAPALAPKVAAPAPRVAAPAPKAATPVPEMVTPAPAAAPPAKPAARPAPPSAPRVRAATPAPAPTSGSRPAVTHTRAEPSAPAPVAAEPAPRAAPPSAARPGPACSEAVAALGLCSPGTPRKDP